MKGKLVRSIIFILGFYLIVSFSRDILDLKKKGEEVGKERLKLESLKEENFQLKTRLEYVQSSEFIEKEARDKLGLARPGETLAILPKSNLETMVQSQKDEKKEELPNWKKWWQLFF